MLPQRCKPEELLSLLFLVTLVLRPGTKQRIGAK